MGSSVTSPSLVVHSSRSSLCAQKCPDMTAELSRAAHPHTTSDTHTHTHTHMKYMHTQCTHSIHKHACTYNVHRPNYTQEMCAHMCTHTVHTCACILMHTDLHTCTQYIQACTHRHQHTWYIHAHTCMYTQTHSCMHTQYAHIHTQVCAARHTHIYIFMHIYTHVHLVWVHSKVLALQRGPTAPGRLFPAGWSPVNPSCPLRPLVGMVQALDAFSEVLWDGWVSPSIWNKIHLSVCI
jgi:hypothetical protein